MPLFRHLRKTRRLMWSRHRGRRRERLKKCIGRNVYDTDQASRIGTHKFSDTAQATLYRKFSANEFFLHLEILGTKEELVAITSVKAREWAMTHLTANECNLLNAMEQAGAGDRIMRIRITTACYNTINRICAKHHIPRSVIIEFAAQYFSEKFEG